MGKPDKLAAPVGRWARVLRKGVSKMGLEVFHSREEDSVRVSVRPSQELGTTYAKIYPTGVEEAMSAN